MAADKDKRSDSVIHDMMHNDEFKHFFKTIMKEAVKEESTEYWERITALEKQVGRYGRYGPVMTDSLRLQQHHTTSDDPGQGCKAHEGGIRP